MSDTWQQLLQDAEAEKLRLEGLREEIEQLYAELADSDVEDEAFGRVLERLNVILEPLNQLNARGQGLAYGEDADAFVDDLEVDEPSDVYDVVGQIINEAKERNSR